METDLLTTKQAAGLLGVTPGRVNQLAAEGKLASAVKAEGIRGARFYRRSDVEALADERRAS